MKIDFTGRNFTVSPAIKKHITEQLKKIDTVLHEANRAHVILSVEKHHRHVAEIVVHWNDRALTSKADTTDMYMSSTQAIEKIRTQAVKLKGRIIDRQQGAKSTAKVAPNPEPPAKLAPAAPRIIRSRKHPVKPMTAEEASIILAGLNDPFVVFQNVENGRVSIIFKRKDGNYGLVEA
jgi:putative sigma-54 modulation protein